MQRSPFAPANKRTVHDKTNLTRDSASSHTQEMGAGSRGSDEDSILHLTYLLPQGPLKEVSIF